MDSYLWLIIGVALTIVAAVSKKKEKQRAEQKQGRHANVPSFEDIIRQLTEDGDDEPTKTQSAHQTVRVQSHKPYRSPEIRVRRNNNRVAAPATSKEVSTVEKSQDSPITAETFDLRSAVIYSEIMRPKWQDEE